MTDALAALEQTLGYTFRARALLQRALTHRSLSGANNERLEFLGDAILSAIMAEALYQQFPNAREGKLSRLRSSLVNGETLARIARTLTLSDHVRLGSGEQKSGGQFRESILSDALEAVIGAVYLDSDFNQTRQVVLTWYHACYDDLSAVEPTKDAKSRLQEWLQAKKYPLPTYDASVSGEAHQQVFAVRCTVAGLSIETEGVSSSRRKAEQIAAEKFLEQLDD